MIATLSALMLACAPMPRPPPMPPPPVVKVRCEGIDEVTRDARGNEVTRIKEANRCIRPVRLTSDPRITFGLSSRG